jgi:hypothetical protein
MQDAMMQHLLHAISDPKFGAIINDFYNLQGRVCVADGGRPRLVTAVGTLLDTIGDILVDDEEMNLLDAIMVDPSNHEKKKNRSVDEILLNVASIRQFIADDSGFEYMLLALWLFRTKISDDQSMLALECDAILAKLDTILALLGLTDVSTTELWAKAARLGTRRDTLWTSVKTILMITEECCSVDNTL